MRLMFRPFQRRDSLLAKTSKSLAVYFSSFVPASLFLIVLGMSSQLSQAGLSGTENPNPAGTLGQYATSSSEASQSAENTVPSWVSDKEQPIYSPEDLTSGSKDAGATSPTTAPSAKPLLIPTPNAWSAGIVGLSVLMAIRLYRRVRAGM